MDRLAKAFALTLIVILTCCCIFLIFFLVRDEGEEIIEDPIELFSKIDGKGVKSASKEEEPSTIALELHKNYHLFNHKNCGTEFIEPVGNRVFYGQKTKLLSNPWLVALSYNLSTNTESVECSGTLISENLVMTAAHCIHPSLVAIRLGEYDLSTEVDCNNETCADRVQEIREFEVLLHGEYDNRIKTLYDIAMIRLKERAEMHRNNIGTICLPFEFAETSKSLFTVGWGTTENDKKPDVPFIASVQLRRNDVCGKKLGFTLRSEHICAGGNEGDSCRGDSGGPLQRPQLFKGSVRAQTVQYGIVSFGKKGNCGEVSAVYTKVHSYLRWILDNAISENFRKLQPRRKL